MDDWGDSTGRERVRRLGHGGFLATLAGVPVAALGLLQLGHALDPHFVATMPTPQTVAAEVACFDEPPPGAPRTREANALVVSWSGGTYGILGARTNGIGLGELIAIAGRLPLGVPAPCRSCA